MFKKEYHLRCLPRAVDQACSRGPPTTQTVDTALGCPLRPDGEAVLLETLPSANDWEMASLLAFRVQGGLWGRKPIDGHSSVLHILQSALNL